MTSADVIQSLWMFVSKASDYFMYEAPHRDILKTWLGHPDYLRNDGKQKILIH